MSGRVILRLILVTFILLLVQSTVMLSIRVDGVHPDLLWLLPITAGLLDGPETGAIVGFWTGLAFDLVLPTPFGLSALVGCIIGYSAGLLAGTVVERPGWFTPVAAIIGSVAADMLFAVLGAVLGEQQMVEVDFAALAVVVAVSAAVVVIPVNRMMRWALFPEGTRRTLVSAHGNESRPW
ncbi:MAG: rod shape-determining protein MreD [Acidimicrobiales bacterium]